MKRVTVILLLAIIAAAAVLGGYMLFSQQRLRGHTYYTDADSIRVRIDDMAARDVLWEPPRNLGETINTDRDEFATRVSTDGLTMYFVRVDDEGDADIYFAERRPRGWTEPQPFDAINSEFDEIGAAPSFDGDAVYFHSNRPGGLGGYDLWVTHRTEDGWSDPENLGPTVNSRFHDTGPAPARTGDLYFASNRPKQTGTTAGDAGWSPDLVDQIEENDADLYVAALTATGLAEPVALDALNSPADERSPAVTPRGDFLYFASDRGGGSGGFDLYRSRIAPDIPMRAEALGPAINTEANELDPTLDAAGFVLYFSSDRALAGAPDAPAATAHYDLHSAATREVFRQTDALAARVDWGEFWQVLWPILLWLLVALLLFLILLKLYHRAEFNRLSLLAKCLIASLLVHVLIMLMMTAWTVTSNFAGFLREQGERRVALISNADAIQSQLFGGLTDVTMESQREPASERAETTIDAPRENPAIEQAQLTVTEQAAAAEERLVSNAPAHESSPSTDAPAARPIATEIEVAQMNDLAIPEQTNRATGREQAMTQPAATNPTINTREAGAASQPERVATTQAQVQPDAAASDLPDTPLTQNTTASESQPSDSRPVTTATPMEVATTDVPTSTFVPQPNLPEAAGVESTEQTATITAPSTATATGQQGAVTDIRAVRSRSQSTILNPSEVATESDQTIANANPAMRDAEAPEMPLATAAPIPLDLDSRTSADVAVALPELSGPAGEQTTEESTTEISVPSQLAGNAERVSKDAPRIATSNAGTSAAFDPAAIAESEADTSLAAPADARSDGAPALQQAAAPTQFDPLALPALTNAGSTRLPELEDASREGNADSGEQTVEVAARGERESPGRVATSTAVDAPPVAELQNLAPSRVSGTESRTDQRLAASSAPSTESRPAPTPLASADLPMVALNPPGIGDVLDNLPIPTQRVAGENPLGQRAAAERAEILEAMGGSEETEAAVADALDWLARHQSRDGLWDADRFDDHCEECGGETSLNGDIAITSLAILAFLGADHTHDQPGPYKDNVLRALDWLVKQQGRDGGFLGPRGARETMYSHGIATIALCEAYAMTRDLSLQQPAERATQFIRNAVNPDGGGWRYVPGQFGDTSVTGWQVMALASARRAGIDVPRNEFSHVHRWMELVRHPERRGIYGYQPGRQYTEAMTAEGMFIRQLLGISPDDRDMRASARFLMNNLPDWESAPNTYYWYYGTLAMFHHGGRPWRDWNEALKGELLAHQRTSGEARGSWDPVDQWAREGGRVYQTAICALSLEVYYRYLPMFQEESVIDPVGTIRGRVVDRETDEPIEGASVSLDLHDRPAIVARTDEDGRYIILAPEMSQFFAVSASKPRYNPQSVSGSADELRGKVMERNFALEPMRRDIIAMEADPQVHHLGNDQFEGRINSQFQRPAEGLHWTATFETDRDTLANYEFAELTLLCKGAQASNEIRINGRRLRQRLTDSPNNGDYGEFGVRFNIDLLNDGENTIRITASDDLGDIDDFEFVNVQIRLTND